MSSIEEPIPADLLRILEDSDEDESEEEFPAIMFMEDMHQEDDSLVDLADLVERSNLGATNDKGSEEEDSDDEGTHMPLAINSSALNDDVVEPEPQEIPGPSLASSDWEPHPDLASASASEEQLHLGVAGARVRGRAGRGREASARSGKGGRGRKEEEAGERGGSAAGRSDWVCGQPLAERFSTDKELPQDVRDEIGLLTADHERREDDAGVQGAVFEDALDEEEEVYYECEDFVWQPMGEWKGTKENFLRERTGPTSVFGSAYEAFRAYWDDDIISQIVLESNRYAQGVRGEKFRRQWFETNVDEILVLFAFWMMLGIIRMPSIKSCFTKIPMMQADIFRCLLSEDRYWNLNRAFHLANGSSNTNDPEDVLYPMGNVIDHLNSKFKEHYIMDQDVCIDKSRTLWKGPLKFMQYLKVKTYQLWESKTGYVWSFFVHVGHRSTSDSTLPSSVSFVMKLVRPILNLGHVLYMDNWFNSPQLARYLKRGGTDCVGTLRPNRKNVPPVLRKAVLSEGQFVARQSGDVAVVALQDWERLYLISTYHSTAQVQTEATPGCPAQYELQLIQDYNLGMGGVDRSDHKLEPYLMGRKQCRNWTKKLFKHLLNMSIQNARVLFEKSSGVKVDSLVFRITLVKAIIGRHLPSVSLRQQGVSLPSQPSLRRLTERHFIRRIPVTDEMRASTHKSNLGRANCVWCRDCGRNIETVYHCPECKVALCLDRGCFKLYHTVAEPGPEHRI